MKPLFKYVILFLGIIFAILIVYFFVGYTKPASQMKWGVSFSLKHTKFLEIDARETFSALLDDLKVKHFRLILHWDLIEPEKGQYDFKEFDWQMNEIEKRNGTAILAIGMKTPHWPECHLPQWAVSMKKEEQQEAILSMIENVVSRYKDSKVLDSWQVENEIFLNFGACPWRDEKFLAKEIELVRRLDSKHQIIITDSGELSFWIKTAKYGDILGITTYKRVWQEQIRQYVSYIFPPVFYHRKAELLKMHTGKEVIGVELQAEPWCANSIMNTAVWEQKETMDYKQFGENVKFAKDTGFDTFYFWGAEWWYYMLTKHNDPEIWNEAIKVFKESI
ncbi:MAG: beta-galactosidase [Candidatus Pacebacteria bacterium]|nr:beta-galactosidase [Candidatus Paceibacterota bacterium]